MMLYVVTGAAGFIGSRLVQAMNRGGIAEILAVDDLSGGLNAKNLYALEIEDYMDKGEFLARLSTGSLDGSVEAVLHQGACTDTMQCDGRYLMGNNYTFSKLLLEWALGRSVPFVYASSASRPSFSRSAWARLLRSFSSFQLPTTSRSSATLGVMMLAPL